MYLEIDDEAEDLQRRDAHAALPVSDGEVLPSRDEVPGGRGAFGLSPHNPIPVNGPVGEAVYLNRLRTLQGARLIYHRLGALTHAGSARPVDRYECIALDGSCRVLLHFAMYHARRSRRAPEGFLLHPWASLAEEERVLVKRHTHGLNACVHGFPWHLPPQVRAALLEQGMAPRDAFARAGQLQGALHRYHIDIARLLARRHETRSRQNLWEDLPCPEAD